MSDLWQTPPALLAALKEAGADLRFDPCPAYNRVEHTDAGHSWVASTRLRTKPDRDNRGTCHLSMPLPIDGLSYDWPPAGHAWVNPPYSGDNKAKWINKCIEQANRGVTSWLILPAKPHEKWFRQAIDGAQQVWCIGKRVRFIDPATGLEGTKPGNGSVVFQFGPKLINIDSIIKSEWGGFIVKDWSIK